MAREVGYYWICRRGKYEVAEYMSAQNWRMFNGGRCGDAYFDEIDERRIEREPMIDAEKREGKR